MAGAIAKRSTPNTGYRVQSPPGKELYVVDANNWPAQIVNRQYITEKEIAGKDLKLPQINSQSQLREESTERTKVRRTSMSKYMQDNENAESP